MTCDLNRESSEHLERAKTELQEQNNNLPQGDMPIKSKSDMPSQILWFSFPLTFWQECSFLFEVLQILTVDISGKIGTNNVK